MIDISLPRDDPPEPVMSPAVAGFDAVWRDVNRGRLLWGLWIFDLGLLGLIVTLFVRRELFYIPLAAMVVGPLIGQIRIVSRRRQNARKWLKFWDSCGQTEAEVRYDVEVFSRQQEEYLGAAMLRNPCARPEPGPGPPSPPAPIPSPGVAYSTAAKAITGTHYVAMGAPVLLAVAGIARAVASNAGTWIVVLLVIGSLVAVIVLFAMVPAGKRGVTFVVGVLAVFIILANVWPRDPCSKIMDDRAERDSVQAKFNSAETMGESSLRLEALHAINARIDEDARECRNNGGTEKFADLKLTP